jgi:hypothetical protein
MKKIIVPILVLMLGMSIHALPFGIGKSFDMEIGPMSEEDDEYFDYHVLNGNAYDVYNIIKDRDVGTRELYIQYTGRTESQIKDILSNLNGVSYSEITEIVSFAKKSGAYLFKYSDGEYFWYVYVEYD